MLKWFLMSAIVAIGLYIAKKRKEKIDAEDIELSNKQTSTDFEKVLDSTERKPGEDSVAYLARCMREAENENQE